MHDFAHIGVGQLLLDNVEVVRQLGEGGFSKVFLGRQLSTGQLVAIKVLRWDSHLTDTTIAQQAARLDRETRICAGLHHPHIVRLLDRGQLPDRTPVAVFEYVPGDTLREQLRRGGAICPTRVQTLMSQVLDALACAHAAGVIHRDLKPDNIMVTSTGGQTHAKVLDFGLGALVTGAQGADYHSLTLSGETLGTPSYCAPEQLRGEPPSPKSDIYAWGLVVLECLLGRSVMAGATLAEVFHRQLSTDEVPLPAGLVGHPLGSLLRRVLRKDPRARPNDAPALCEEFRTLHVTDLLDALGQSETRVAESVDQTAVGRSPVRTYRERRQITVLCCGLSVVSTRDTDPDFEALDAVQQDQLVFCADTLARFGGTAGGRLGDKLVAYFGHPQASDSDTRRAARAALELVNQIRGRSSLLETEHGLRLDLRVALHTGFVIGAQNGDPSGSTVNIPLRLEPHVAPGQILVSDPTRQMLDNCAAFEPAGAFEITGGKRPLHVFRLLSERALEALTTPSRSKRPLLGRSEPFLSLMNDFEAVLAGHGRSTLVSGEAGIGKSRLLAELKSEIAPRLTRSWEARCLPEERNTALHPIIEMLRRELQLTAASEADARKLISRLEAVNIDVSRAGAICCAWFGLPVPEGLAPSSLSPQLQKAELLTSLERLVQPRSASEVSLLAVEDLHWADPTTLEFLARLQANIGHAPLLLLQTARPEFVFKTTPSHHRDVQLSRLDSRDVALLAEYHSNGATLTREQLQTIVERTDGVPLFVEELTKMLVETLAADSPSASARFKQPQLSDAPLAALPITLRESLTSRLDRLGLAKETAQLAAAIGREFDFDLLAAATRRAPTDLRAELSTLAAADLVYQREQRENATYLFRHALIRDAAYESLAREGRVAAHGRIVEALAARGNCRPVELARHYAGAELYGSATITMAEAARLAQERSLHEETLALCEQALAWNRLREDDATACAETELSINRTLLPALIALRGLGTEELLELSRRNDRLLELLDAHKPELTRSARLEQEHRNRWLEFQRVHFSADSARAVVMGESLLADMRAAGQRQPQLQVLPLLAQAYHWMGDLRTALRRFEDALALYDTEKDTELWVEYGLEPRCQSLYLMSHALTYAGRPDSAKRCVEQCLAWAKELDCPRASDGGVFFGALSDYLCGDKDAVKASAAHLQTNHATGAADQWLVAGWRMVYDWAEGTTEHTTRFVDGALQMGHLGAMCWFEAMLAETDIEQGRWEAASERLRSSLARCAETGEVSTMPIAHTLLGEYLHHRAGKLTPESAHHFETAMRMSVKHGTHWLTMLSAAKYSKLLHASGRSHQADDLLASALYRLEEGFGTPAYRNAAALLRNATLPSQPMKAIAQ